MAISIGTNGNDYLLGTPSADTIQGLGGNDFISGDGGDDLLSGGDGDDLLRGGAGNDTIDGGANGPFVDTADYSDSTAGVTVNLALGTANDGLGGTDTLLGIEAINGSAHADTLTGDAGMNWFRPYAGNDVVDGGAGHDVVFYEGSSSGVVVNLQLGTASGMDIGTDVIDSIEAVHGSYHDDQVTLANVGGYVFGRAGDDMLFGGAGNDNFIGGSGNDVIYGGAGFDHLSYVEDTYDGGVLAPTGAGVTVNLATGTATDNWGTTDSFYGIEGVRGSTFNDQLTGDANTNFIDGDAGDDAIFGAGGNDTLTGGLGDDLLDGGAGTADNASYLGSSAAVFVDLAAGAATGGAGNDTLVNIENLTGSNFNDTLIGDAGTNFIDGRGGDDIVFGGAGRDNFVGGAGDDHFDGGAILDRANYTDLNTISYASSTSAVAIDLAAGLVQDGMGGVDTLANINFVTGSLFNDTFLGSSDETLFEQFDGGLGNDVIDGGALDFVLQRNSNRVNYATANGAVTVDLAAGMATGAAGADTLLNINHATGSNFADLLLGSASAMPEQFEGRGGNDTIDGRGGLDIVRYDSGAAGVSVNLVTGVASDGLGGTDTLLNIEGIRGSAHDDVLTGGKAANGTGATDGIELFTGNAGDDIIDGGGGYDRADYLTSTAGVTVTLGGSEQGSASDGFGGTDVLISIEGVRGSVFDDVLIGSDSAVFESFEGVAGNDIIDGRGGIDRVDYHFAISGVIVDLKAGTALDGYGGSDSLSNIENIRGSSFADLITGGRGSNRIEGGAGNDVIDGGAGFDTAVFSGAQADYTIDRHGITVTVTGADGIDSLRSVETLSFSDGDLVLWGPGAQGNGNGGVALVGVWEA